MAGPHVLSALKAKRAEMAGEVEAAERVLTSLRARLAAVDTTILLFDPEAEPGRIPAKMMRRRTAGLPGRGGMSRPVLDVLREAGGVMTTREVALAVMRVRCLDASDPEAATLAVERVAQALRRRRDAGAVRSEPGPGKCSLWTLA